MIKIGNKIWRTLNQPLYVNNKKVLEVWANDTLVYPENSANFIKVRGKVSFNEAYGEDEQSGLGYRRPAYSGVFTGTAEFAACLICSRFSNNHFVLTGNNSNTMEWGPKSISYLNTDPIETSQGPRGGSCIISHSTKIRKAIGFAETEDSGGNMPSYWVSDKIIYRQNISSFPLLPEESYYGSNGYSYTAKLMNPVCTEITYLNGTHKSEESEVARISQRDARFERTINNVQFIMNLEYFRKSGAYLSLLIPNIIRENGMLLTNITYRQEPLPDRTADATMVYGHVRPLFCIPVTDIMYFGDYYTAPEEMLDVTAADLDF